jgi:hypothetical protein
MTYLFSNTVSVSNEVEIKNDANNSIPIVGNVNVFYQSTEVTANNPLPVTLGSNTINIIGNIAIPTTVNVSSSPENPVHNHITEVGTSGLLTVPYLPVGGNVNVTNLVTITGNVTANGTVNIGNTVQVNVVNFPQTQNVNIVSLPEVEIKNDNGNPISISKDTSLNSNTNPIFVKGTSDTSFFSPTQSDAFGRLRTSLPLTFFDSSHRYADNGLWSTSNTAGTTVTFNANEGVIDMTANTLNGASVTRESIKVFPYQPGKSLLILNTFTMNTPKINLLQRCGYYGANNGIYFEVDGENLNIVKRSFVSGSVVETRISRNGGVYGPGDTGWNGNRISGLQIDKSQIFWMDIEWLGVGSVRTGFIINGEFIVCHIFNHANIITTTYMTTATLPIRYEIKNTGTTASNSTLKQICSSVISEGGYELRGRQQAINIPITAPRTLTTAGTYYPIISVRLKADRLDAVVILTALSIMGVGNGKNFHWEVKSGLTTSGGSWLSAGTDSAVEYNITGTSQTGGRVLASGFINSSNQGSPTVDILKEALFKFQLERNGLTNTPSELALVIACSTDDEEVYASLDWEEVTR